MKCISILFAPKVLNYNLNLDEVDTPTHELISMLKGADIISKDVRFTFDEMHIFNDVQGNIIEVVLNGWVEIHSSLDASSERRWIEDAIVHMLENWDKTYKDLIGQQELMCVYRETEYPCLDDIASI